MQIFTNCICWGSDPNSVTHYMKLLPPILVYTGAHTKLKRRKAHGQFYTFAPTHLAHGCELKFVFWQVNETRTNSHIKTSASLIWTSELQNSAVLCERKHSSPALSICQSPEELPTPSTHAWTRWPRAQRPGTKAFSSSCPGWWGTS